MDRFCLTDAQWAKMEPHCLGKPSDPGRTGGDNRLFVEAVLWIARTGSPWRDLPPLFGKWNTVFKRYRDWVKADVFARLFDACRTSRTWNTPWWTPPSSKFTATARAQKGDSKPGHRQIERRPDDENSGAHRCARQSGALRLAAGPSPRHGRRCPADRRRIVRRSSPTRHSIPTGSSPNSTNAAPASSSRSGRNAQTRFPSMRRSTSGGISSRISSANSRSSSASPCAATKPTPASLR